MVIKTLKQMPCQWLYNPIFEITAVGNIIEMLGNIIKMLKFLPQSLSVSAAVTI